MKRLLFGILITLIYLPAFSQSAMGRYASRMTPEGSIFFVMPYKLGKTEEIKKFEYDMTFLSWTDSVTINFTFQSSSMGLPESLSLCNDTDKFICNNYTLLFMDIIKKGYEIRVTAKFAATDIKLLIDSKSPMAFRFVQGGRNCCASYKNDTWQKDRKKLIDIYQLYQYAK